MSIANRTPKNWPEVIMLVAIAATPAGVRAWAAWAMAWAFSAPFIVLSCGYSTKCWLTPLVHSASAVNTTTPVRNSHHVFVVRIFMISALARRTGPAPVRGAWASAGLPSRVT